MKNFIISATFLLCAILALHFLSFAPIVNYTVTFIASSLLFLLFAYYLFRNDIPHNAIFAVVIISLVVRLSFLFTFPVGSDDIYRYIWDGKVQMNFINPYQYAPNSDELKHLSTSIIPRFVNHPEMKTMYFPFSEWLFFVAYALSGEEVWGYKLLLLVAEIFSLYGLVLLTKRLNIPLKFILLYALCPMLFYEYAIDAHLDGFGLPLLIFSLYFYLSEKKFLGLFLLGCSLSVKPAALILLPVFFFYEREWKDRLRILVIPIVTLGLQFLPYFISVNPFEALFAFTKHWTFNGFVFNTLNLYFSNNQTTRIICGIILLIAVMMISLSKKQFTDKVYYAVLSLLLCSPIVHPWYVGWLAVLLPVARKWSGIVYVSTLSLTSFTYISYQLHGVWSEPPIQWLAVYVPVICFYIRELFYDSGPIDIN